MEFVMECLAKYWWIPVTIIILIILYLPKK